MTESVPVSRGALSAYPLADIELEDLGSHAHAGTTFLLDICADSFINIRGPGHNSAFARAIARACINKLPAQANSYSRTPTRKLAWLSPDEWLLLAPAADTRSLVAELEKRLVKHHHAVNDLSSGMSRFRIQGPHCNALVAKGCTIDLHPTVWHDLSAAQTLIAKSPVLMLGVAPQCIDIVVRRSFAEYLWEWLLAAGREFELQTGRLASLYE